PLREAAIHSPEEDPVRSLGIQLDDAGACPFFRTCSAICPKDAHHSFSPFDAGRPGRFLRCLPGLAFRRAASTLWGEAMVGVLRADRRAGPEERTSARVIELNPEGADGIFLGGVNRCFPER